jgi:hypothetical protein
MNFVNFPDIEGFHNIVKFTKAYPEHATRPIAYRGKIKIHGSNAGIRLVGGEVGAQSRTQIVTPESDNAGFARWVKSCESYWKSLSIGLDCTVYGEWCGPGIMKGTAINQIPKKAFVVFAIDLKIKVDGEEETVFMSDPVAIEKLLGDRPDDVYVLPWYGDAFTVDFKNEANLRKTADMLNAVVEEIEPCDPWVKKVFGIEGTAEGIVYYPDTVSRDIVRNFMFKAKGDKHRVVKVKEAVQIDPEIAASVDGFVTMFVTEARLEQGLAAIGGSLEMKNVGAFLKWMNQDVLKESSAELEASNLTWEQVQKHVTVATRNWFIQKNKEI